MLRRILAACDIDMLAFLQFPPSSILKPFRTNLLRLVLFTNYRHALSLPCKSLQIVSSFSTPNFLIFKQQSNLLVCYVLATFFCRTFTRGEVERDDAVSVWCRGWVRSGAECRGVRQVDDVQSIFSCLSDDALLKRKEDGHRTAPFFAPLAGARHIPVSSRSKA